MFKPEFNEQEVNTLIQLMDIAVKTAGLQVAEIAVVLTKKLQDSKVKAEDASE